MKLYEEDNKIKKFEPCFPFPTLHEVSKYGLEITLYLDTFHVVQYQNYELYAKTSLPLPADFIHELSLIWVTFI